MRASTRHAGSRGRAKGPEAPAGTDRQNTHSDDEDEDMFVPEEDLGAERAMLPMSFGKVVPDMTPSLDVHNSTMRKETKGALAIAAKGTVQFGSRAGVNRRPKGVAEEAQAQPELNAGEGMGAETPEPQDECESDGMEEEVPVPGKEEEALPVSHEVSIPALDKAVTALCLDPKGSRMAVGGMDGVIKLFDFAGMNEEKRAFRGLEPVEGHLVQGLAFNSSGGMLLVVCSDSHARVYDRDGSTKPIQSTVKGDMYVRDMAQTKGHTQMLTDGKWHPLRQEQWMTSSLDGTLRIWDLNATPVGMDQVLPSVHVLKCLDKRGVCVGGASGRGGGLYPCCCALNALDGKTMAGGCSDGSVQLFFEKARYQKPDRILRMAHTGPVCSITFAGEAGQPSTMFTRSLDSTVKVWDCRMLSDAKGPMHTWTGLPTSQEKASVCVSPDGRHVAVGTSSDARGAAAGAAAVRVFDAKSFKPIRSLDFGRRAPTHVAWPREQNQLFVGTSAGDVSVLYSPFSSKKGALFFVGKRVKSKTLGLAEAEGTMGPIFNMTDGKDIQRFYATGHGNMVRIRNQEARHSQRTLTPIKPPETKGPVGKQTDSAAFAALAIQAGAQHLHLRSTGNIEPDSQKALLAYAGKAKDWGLFDTAYSKTQPEKLLDYSDDVSEGDKRMMESLKGDFCRKCGQKVCRCVDYSVWGQKKQRTS